MALPTETKNPHSKIDDMKKHLLRIKDQIRSFYHANEGAKLDNPHFTIISDDCWGGRFTEATTLST